MLEELFSEKIDEILRLVEENDKIIQSMRKSLGDEIEGIEAMRKLLEERRSKDGL